MNIPVLCTDEPIIAQMSIQNRDFKLHNVITQCPKLSQQLRTKQDVVRSKLPPHILSEPKKDNYYFLSIFHCTRGIYFKSPYRSSLYTPLSISLYLTYSFQRSIRAFIETSSETPAYFSSQSYDIAYSSISCTFGHSPANRFLFFERVRLWKHLSGIHRLRIIQIRHPHLFFGAYLFDIFHAVHPPFPILVRFCSYFQTITDPVCQ